MKQTVTFNDFAEAFTDCGREDAFSHDGLRALFDYMEELEVEGGEEIELDVIALCCDYTEYIDFDDFNKDNDTAYEDLDAIRENYMVIDVDGESFIVIE